MSEYLTDPRANDLRLRLRYESDNLEGALKQLATDVTEICPFVCTSAYFETAITDTFHELEVDNTLKGIEKAFYYLDLDRFSLEWVNTYIAKSKHARQILNRLRNVYAMENDL